VISIRAPRPDELERLRDIERAAGQLFAAAGLPDIAAHEPDSVESLAEYVDVGHAWVIAKDDVVVVGYAVVDIVDGLAHLEQLSVHPDWGGQGLGAQLLEHLCEWARAQHFAAVTLTTFNHLAWNAPFYAAHGFRVLDEDELGPELGRLREEEAKAGLDPTLRVCMQRRL
jgi:GNAT superfamily N-acetyltransferase